MIRFTFFIQQTALNLVILKLVCRSLHLQNKHPPCPQKMKLFLLSLDSNVILVNIFIDEEIYVNNISHFVKLTCKGLQIITKYYSKMWG